MQKLPGQQQQSMFGNNSMQNNQSSSLFNKPKSTFANQNNQAGQSMFNQNNQGGLMRVNATMGQGGMNNSSATSAFTFANQNSNNNNNQMGGFMNRNNANNNLFNNNMSQSRMMTGNQMQNFNKQTSWQKKDYSLLDKKIKEKGFIINRDPNNMHGDTIQGMAFVEMGNVVKLVTTGWDKTIRIWNCSMQMNNSYNIQTSNSKYRPPKGFLNTIFERKIDLGVYGMGLDLIPEMNAILIYCGDCTIRKLDLNTMQVSIMLNLTYLPLRAFFYQPMGALIVTGYHDFLEVYQGNNMQQPSLKVKLANMTVAADFEGQLLTIAMRNDMLSVVEIKTLLNGMFNSMSHLPVQKSLLESPISNVKSCPENGTIIIVSVDGRIINSTFQTMAHANQAQEVIIPKSIEENKRTFIFMGHGRKIGKTKSHAKTEVYNINSICTYTGIPGFVITTGSDGVVVYWDLNSKSKVKSLDLNADISVSTISKSGKYGAVGLGYSWSKGVWGVDEAERPAIATFIIEEKDTKAPPSKKSGKGGHYRH